jgi:hypothetical protein
LEAEDALVQVELGTLFAFNFHHLDSFSWAVAAAESAGYAEVDVEDLFASEAFRRDALHEGVLASGAFLEEVAEDLSEHGRDSGFLCCCFRHFYVHTKG